MLDKRSRIPGSKPRSLMLSALRTVSTAIFLLLSICSVSDVSLSQQGGKKEVEGTNSHEYFFPFVSFFNLLLYHPFFLIKKKRDARRVEIPYIWSRQSYIEGIRVSLFATPGLRQQEVGGFGGMGVRPRLIRLAGWPVSQKRNDGQQHPSVAPGRGNSE